MRVIVTDVVTFLARRTSVKHHLAMRADTIPLRRGDIVTVLSLVLFLWRPGEIIAANLDVVVRELAQLVVVHTEQLCLLGRPQGQPGDGIDGDSDDGRDDKGVRTCGCDVRNLDIQLLVVVDDPAADSGAGVDAIEADDSVVAEEGVEKKADDTGNAVFGEDVHGVVDADPVFDFAG